MRREERLRAVGFRIEVTNRSIERDLVLLLPPHPSALTHVRTIDEKGYDVSPMPPDRFIAGRRAAVPSGYTLERVRPGRSHAWFIRAPTQARLDPRKPTNEKNLGPLPKGKYLVDICTALPYYAQPAGAKSPPRSPDIRELRLILPPISVTIDPAITIKNLIEAYVHSEERLQRLSLHFQLQRKRLKARIDAEERKRALKH